MREELGDQWIEIIDGQKHMVKAVAPIELCKGCFFNCNQGGCCWKGFDNCQMGSFFIIKDLGVINEDGCLPSPWGGYPKVIRVGKPNFVTYFNVSYVQKSEKGKGSLQVQVTGKTKQEAIDAWNRRVM